MINCGQQETNTQRKVVHAFAPTPSSNPYFTHHYFKGLARSFFLSKRKQAASYAVEKIHFPKASLLFSQHAPADHLFIIRKGWVKLFQTLPGGKQIVVELLPADRLVGMDCFAGRPFYRFSAEAAEDIEVIRIPKKNMENEMRCCPELTLDMLSYTYKLHEYKRRESLLHLLPNAPNRLGAFLLRLCPNGKNKSATLDLPSDHFVISKALGMAADSYAKALDMLVDEGLIRMCGKQIEIDSIKKLISYVYGNAAICFANDIGYPSISGCKSNDNETNGP